MYEEGLEGAIDGLGEEQHGLFQIAGVSCQQGEEVAMCDPPCHCASLHKALDNLIRSIVVWVRRSEQKKGEGGREAEEERR